MHLPANIRLRPIRTSDRALLQSIYFSTREIELAQLNWSREQKEKFLNDQFNVQHRHYQSHFPRADFNIVQHDAEDIGRLYVDWHGTEVWLIDIALLPQWRHQGIGAGILHSVLDAVDRLGKFISLHVEVNNSALSLYRSLGFEKVGDDGVYFKLSRAPCALVA